MQHVALRRAPTRLLTTAKPVPVTRRAMPKLPSCMVGVGHRTQTTAPTRKPAACVAPADGLLASGFLYYTCQLQFCTHTHTVL
eukprot:323122-Prymnesium_polylepis.1